ADAAAPIEDIVRDPMAVIEAERDSDAALVRLPRPPETFAPERINSRGIALDQPTVRQALLADMGAELERPVAAAPIVDGRTLAAAGPGQLVPCPHDRRERIGTVHPATPAAIAQAVAGAERAARAWERAGGPARAAILERAADLYERERARLMAV